MIRKKRIYTLQTWLLLQSINGCIKETKWSKERENMKWKYARSIARNDAISAALRDSCTMEKLKKQFIDRIMRFIIWNWTHQQPVPDEMIWNAVKFAYTPVFNLAANWINGYRSTASFFIISRFLSRLRESKVQCRRYLTQHTSVYAPARIQRSDARDRADWRAVRSSPRDDVQQSAAGDVSELQSSRCKMKSHWMKRRDLSAKSNERRPAVGSDRVQLCSSDESMQL